MTEFRHRTRFDLADPLSGQREEGADLFERARLAPVEAEAQLENLSFALVERFEEMGDLGPQHGRERCRFDVDVGVADEAAELGRGVAANGGVETGRDGGDVANTAHHRDRDADVVGDFVIGRMPAERGREFTLGPRDLRPAVGDVDRHSDRGRAVGDAALDRLADPPRGVRRELEALASVELLDGADQADVAFLHEVEQIDAGDWYFLAIETTRRKLAHTNWSVASSPSRTAAGPGGARPGSGLRLTPAGRAASAPAATAAPSLASSSRVRSRWLPTPVRYIRAMSMSPREARWGTDRGVAIHAPGRLDAECHSDR